MGEGENKSPSLLGYTNKKLKKIQQGFSFLHPKFVKHLHLRRFKKSCTNSANGLDPLANSTTVSSHHLMGQTREVSCKVVSVKRLHLKLLKNPRYNIWFNKFRNHKKANYAYLVVALLLFSSFLLTSLLMHKAVATATMSWTNNGDFSMNKVGACEATTLNGVTVTGAAYTDPTCATAGADANITLAAGPIPLNNITQVSGGGSHALALKNDGTVWAWGYNGNGQLGNGTRAAKTFPTQVKDSAGTGYLTNIVAIAAGGIHSVAVKSDGTVWAWGYNGHGEVGDSSAVDRTLPVQTLTVTNITSVTAGYFHTLMLKNDGTIWGCGMGQFGQLGEGGSQRLSPVQVKGPAGTGYLTDITAIAAGIGGNGTGYHSLARRNDGTVWSFGLNNYGQIGDDTTTNRLYPVQVKDATGTGYLSNITMIAAGSEHSLALDSNGAIWSWGMGIYGQMGNGAAVSKKLPVQAEGVSLNGVTKIASRSDHSLALKNDGTLWAWGRGNYGQLGDNAIGIKTVPAQVKDIAGTGYITGVTAIDGGSNTTLAITNGGLVWGWGYDAYGQIGYGDNVTRKTPAYVYATANTVNLSNVTKIVSGNYFTLALKNDGTVWAWGANGSGQLGDGSTTARGIPVLVGGGYFNNIIDIAAGNSHSLAIKNDGTLWAWGYGGLANLGDGGNTDRYSPVQVKDTAGTGYITNIIAAAAGRDFSYALKSDGTVWAWGTGSSGNLGDGAAVQRWLPVQVKDAAGTGYLTNITAIALTKYYFALALRDDGTLWSWGTNGNGQLGDGTTTQRNLPVQVKDATGAGYLTGITAITGGSGHSMALDNTGAVWAWGTNGNGELGRYTTPGDNKLPAKVVDAAGTGYLSGITKISGGYLHSLAVANDGTAWGWGYNVDGALGSNATGGNNRPVHLLDEVGVGNLANTTGIAGEAYSSFALKSNGTVVGMGRNDSGQLGNGTQIRNLYPTSVFSSVDLNAGYVGTGTASNLIADMGSNRKTKWYDLDWNTSALPANTSLKFNVRSSDDKVTWSAWSADYTQNTPGSTTGNADISAFPFSRYLEVKATFTSTDLVNTPTLTDFTITHMNDQNPPTWVYPATIPVYTNDTKAAALTSNTWTANNNLTSVYADWSGATEPENESGIAHYYVYLGTDPTANPITAGTDMGTTTEGYLNLPTNPTSGTYYLRVTVSDLAGNNLNMPSGSDVFKYLYDGTKPNNPSYISVSPVGWNTVNSFDFSWPEALDPGSGSSNIDYYQYKKAGGGDTWHNTEDRTVYGVTSYQDGRNEFFVRAIDNAGNIALDQTSVYYYYNGSAPSAPSALGVVPPNATTNSFTFTWDEPETHNADIRGYYYSINSEPTINNSVFTTSTTTGAIPAATQQGFNKFYVVAIDADDQINWGSFAQIQFECNTPAPGIPGGVVISDSSNRADENWALTTAWSASAGTVHHYNIYRSTNGVNFSVIGQTGSTGFFDSGLSNTSTYHYKITAVDSAGAESAFSSTVNKQPTGKFTEPPLIVTGPDVDIKATRATITWSTDRVSSSFVTYSKDKSYGESKGQVDAVTSHSVELSGLEAGTTYNFKVQSLDENRDYPIDSAYSGEFSFTTQSAPGISEVNISDIRLTSATVTWKTTTVATSQIVYGKTNSYGQTLEDQSGSAVTTHTVKLDGLDHTTTYFFKIYGTDSDGNQLVSDNYAFNTLTYPRVSNVRFEQQKNSATSTLLVTWVTNVPTSSTVSYNQDGDTAKEVSKSTLETTHSMLISNLQDNQTYYMSVGGRDAYGNPALSDSQRVQTDYDTRPPAITDIVTESSSSGYGLDTKAQIVVSWMTDEPATSQVEYAEGVTGDSYNLRSPEDSNLTTSHVVVLTDLKPSSSYHFRVISKDSSNNQSASEPDSVLTDIARSSIIDIIIKSLQDTLGWLFGG